MTMKAPTTARILAEKALALTCGEGCVDWAVSMLVAGREGHHLAMLAGMVRPFNHFEIAAMRDRALAELGLDDPPPGLAVLTFATELLRAAISDDIELRLAVREVGALCVADDHRQDLYEFYLLDRAIEDWDAGEHSHYWDGATPENIMTIVRARVGEFLGLPVTD